MSLYSFVSAMNSNSGPIFKVSLLGSSVNYICVMSQAHDLVSSIWPSWWSFRYRCLGEISLTRGPMSDSVPECNGWPRFYLVLDNRCTYGAD